MHNVWNVLSNLHRPSMRGVAVARLAKTLAAAAVAGCALLGGLVTAAPPAQASDWLYYDLGEVILTGNTSLGYRFVPGVLERLNEAHERGYHIALLSNIPEAFGATCALKLTTLQTFIANNLRDQPAFPWHLFDAVVVPPFDRYRKPRPYLFLRALAKSCPDRALYVGESLQELEVAHNLGYATFHKASATTLLPDARAVAALLDDQFHVDYPATCDFSARLRDALDVTDQSGVDGCVVELPRAH